MGVDKKIRLPKEKLLVGVRINRFIANAGICSRRKAEQLILDGDVTVNGQVVTQLSCRIQKNDKVQLRGKTLRLERKIYVLLNKPKNFITTTNDPKDRKIVLDLVKHACEETIYPVGRLDRKTMGLLLFTNDGELAKKLAHPSGKIPKVYDVLLNKPLEKCDMDKIKKGLMLEDGKALVDKIELLDSSKKALGVEIHIGKNRIIRRIFESLGYQVIRLDRVVYAHLTKKNLLRGKWRFLTSAEVGQLYSLVG